MSTYPTSLDPSRAPLSTNVQSAPSGHLALHDTVNQAVNDDRAIIDAITGVVGLSGDASSSTGSIIAQLKYLANLSASDEHIQDVIGAFLLGTSGDVTATYNDAGAVETIDLVNVGSAGVYGDSTHYPVVTVDAKGRVSAITLLALPSGNSGFNPLSGSFDAADDAAQGGGSGAAPQAVAITGATMRAVGGGSGDQIRLYILTEANYLANQGAGLTAYLLGLAADLTLTIGAGGAATTGSLPTVAAGKWIAALRYGSSVNAPIFLSRTA